MRGRRLRSAAAALIPWAALAGACGRDEAPPPVTAPEEPAVPPVAEVGPDGPPGLDVPEIAAIPTDPAAVARGEQVFRQRGCGACHAFGSRLVGPDLAGVTGRRTVPWLSKMILHPEEMTKQDPVARQLLQTYLVQMTYQGVTAEELPALLAYLKAEGKD